jgi:DNA (cytosine-5)-methyltransferase 1
MPQQINMFDGLIIDNFAGGGGASTGIELALGRPVDIAINHDKDAIAMHAANHPYTRHFCESVWDIDPREATQGQPVTLAWFSPDCKHFSKARGGRPADKNIRGLAWVAVRWAATVRPQIIILENVEEFKTWGPLGKDGQPDKAQTGKTFRSFVSALRTYGYAVDWRELRACDYGAPTIRKRFFLVARCDGESITWPEPTHGAPGSIGVKSGRLLPYRTAAEIIDWSLPCPSIFDTSQEIRQKYGINAVRPLAEATLRRIARGLQKFVIDNPAPYIVPALVGVGGRARQSRPRGTDEPVATITSKADVALIAPYITSIGQTGFTADRSRPVTAPLNTTVSKAEQCLVSAFLSKYYSGNGSKGSDARGPLNTVTAIDHNALVASHVVKFKGDNVGHPADEPLQTIAAGGLHFGEVRAFMIKYYGAEGETGQPVTEPAHTLTTKHRLGLVTVCGQGYAIADIGLRMLTPRELFNAQGFPPDYVIDVGADGKPITKSAQVARCGNSVCPALAEALVRANLPEVCGAKTETMYDLKMEMAV